MTRVHIGVLGAGDVANHATAERPDDVAAVDALGEQRLAQRLQRGEAFGAFAGRQHHRLARKAALLQRLAQPRAVQALHRFVGHDQHAAELRVERLQFVDAGERVGADRDVVAALPCLR